MRWRTLAVLPVAVLACSAYARVYLTAEQAQASMFPGEKFAPLAIALGDEQTSAIARLSGMKVDTRYTQAWRGERGSVFFVDRVIGKHELISYALGIDSEGRIRQIEILEYREAYGYEVREAAWRRQFVGKTSASSLRLNDDIANMSGATLSCSHVTEGIRRLMAMYQVAIKPHA
jgi:Na+-translocating ferredoxin:NAD+ oxidoreductase RnfG subunit